MNASEQVESILKVLINAAKETRINLSEVKTKVDDFIGTLVPEVEHTKLEQILSQNNFRVEVTA